MKTLDLHGFTHSDALREVERFVNKYWVSDEMDLKVITGNSGPMRGVVIEVLDQYGLDYTIGLLDIDQSYIMIHML